MHEQRTWPASIGVTNKSATFVWCLWPLPSDSKHNEACFFLPILKVLLCLQVAQMLRYGNLAIFIMTDRQNWLLYPLCMYQCSRYPHTAGHHRVGHWNGILWIQQEENVSEMWHHRHVPSWTCQVRGWSPSRYIQQRRISQPQLITLISKYDIAVLLVQLG